MILGRKRVNREIELKLSTAAEDLVRGPNWEQDLQDILDYGDIPLFLDEALQRNKNKVLAGIT